jgi:hypothetical protein
VRASEQSSVAIPELTHGAIECRPFGPESRGLMTKDEILREIYSLPLEAQRQIEDFISVLRDRYNSSEPKTVPTSDLESEAFVGMWRDREDMRDSSGWVRNIRSLS